MARLYADENFPLPVVRALRAAGHDVVTLQEAGHGGQAMSDDEVLDAATGDRRAVLTLHRKDFLRLHQRRAEHGGMVLCTFDPDFAAQSTRVDDAVCAAGALSGKVIRVNRPNA
jgi:hypothetical protein